MEEGSIVTLLGPLKLHLLNMLHLKVVLSLISPHRLEVPVMEMVVVSYGLAARVTMTLGSL